MAHRNRHRQRRKESAEERHAARAERSHQQQLDRLDRMFGKGKGAARERARLHRLIKEAAETQKETKE